MHVHILGICGTFMGGIAALAREAGYRVTGSDANVYPPMSDQLAALGIDVFEGYGPAQFAETPDIVLIGNALSRGNPAVEHVLDQGLAYSSGPQWLADTLLKDRWVLAVAGTHGKSTTTSLLAWILAAAGLEPGFLVGAVPVDFGVTARLGKAPFFVIEADEYDTAFFDKRSKFVHYRPRTLVLNNLEFDHADIFPDLAAIEWQFHQLLRTVPASGRLIVNAADANLARVLERGCWTLAARFAVAGATSEEGAEFRVAVGGHGTRSRLEITGPAGETVTIAWGMHGSHNAANALAALLAARHAGVPLATGCEALGRFRGIKRRLEIIGQPGGITVYDDFAHHPTAIAATLEALRETVGGARIVAVLEPRSNTMRMGVHAAALAPALAQADAVWAFRPEGLRWDLEAGLAPVAGRVLGDVEALAVTLAETLAPGDHVVIMSNGGFGGLHARLLSRLEERAVHGS